MYLGNTIAGPSPDKGGGFGSRLAAYSREKEKGCSQNQSEVSESDGSNDDPGNTGKRNGWNRKNGEEMCSGAHAETFAHGMKKNKRSSWK